MKGLLTCSAVFLIGAAGFAQDPGMQDTVIVNTVYANFGQTSVNVDIFAVTDDSVLFYGMPISWSFESEGIYPSEVFYYNPLTHWDELYDSVLVDEHYIRMLGWGDGIYFLNTYGYRLRCWSIRFTIDSLAPPQIVTIDTTYDPVNGSILFGLIGGTVSFAPAFIPGAIYYGVTSAADEEDPIVPGEFALLRNYPNPFNAKTNIRFVLPKAQEIKLSIYDLLGRQVEILIDGFKDAGIHNVIFNASALSSGVYFYRLRAGDTVETKRMVLLK